MSKETGLPDGAPEGAKHWKDETDVHKLVMVRENYQRGTPEYADITERIRDVQVDALDGTQTGVDKPVSGKDNAAIAGEIEAAKVAGADNPVETVQGTGQENAAEELKGK